ncbi:Ppx/GppA family phosphatase [Mesorhizobium tamadayense]|uniref:Ppx/GppA family phosphatase n=1 Tax=Mesorhizobium tamadayense TaxID=425306 RepID=A0A3P3ESU2_9HYPH|nr:Ppx/GppA phosphatase family protein [Mesorhizobium tamadayense]RRH89470.1 Ppx/GppA family phosphatase [Mesorhizobium tamadayense]
MEDHDTGAGASAVGMSGVSPTESAGPAAGRFSRHAGAHARHADNQGENQKGKTRKRRKRRRGRKVFARDENGAIPLSAPAASHPPQPAAATPQPPVSSVPRRPQQELPVFAALDLGTNNCRLLVAVPSRHGQFRVIDAFSRIVRLGEGLSANGRLGQAAMDRAVEALKICGDKLRNRKIRKARLIATEACRSAENGVEFLDRVEREAGLKLEIIDRQTEARLAVSGCGSLVERDTRGVVLFDIGGGSSEIALIDLTRGQRSPRLANHIVSWTSLPVGVVSLAERFGGRTVTRETFFAMVDDVAARLKAFDGRDRLAHVLASPNFHLLGTSGTVTTLAGVHLDLERYDRRRVDGLWMDRTSVDRMIEKLIGWDFQQRVANPCIGADRADLVLAGCAILEAIRAVWPSERLRVADRGLREGILSELMADDGVWRHDGRRA